MTLERLVEEIRARAEQDLAREQARIEQERAKIVHERDARVLSASSEAQRLAELEAARERAQRLAGAKLQARKLEYEARSRQMGDALSKTRQLLNEFTQSSEYPEVLKRMYAVAVDQLGKQPRVSGRAEDASVLRSIAGKGFQDAPAPILGGLVAETSDGSRRLNLSFDELLRLREDRVRDLLQS